MIMQAQNNKSNQEDDDKVPEPVLVPMNLEFVKVLIRPFVM